jgi:hypothetical protein
MVGIRRIPLLTVVALAVAGLGTISPLPAYASTLTVTSVGLRAPAGRHHLRGTCQRGYRRQLLLPGRLLVQRDHDGDRQQQRNRVQDHQRLLLRWKSLIGMAAG